jgi:hypothetical protein
MTTKRLRIGGLPISNFLKKFSKEPIAKKAYSDYMNFSEKLLQHNGYSRTVKILKEINSRSRHYAAGYPQGDGTIGGKWFKICKISRLPKKIGSLKDFLDKEPNTALLIPNFVYTLYDKPSLDLSTVLGEENSSLDPEDKRLFEVYCKIGCPKLKLAKVDHLFTCKGGPNGPSALSHAQDLLSITDELGYDTMIDLFRLFHGKESWLEKIFLDFSTEMLIYNPKLKFRKDQQTPINAKLEFLAAPAGKTRIIYVANWWVQATLLPMHEALMNCFYYIGNDATWDQNSGVKKIIEWSEQKVETFCFDLTAATDRWPASHQFVVVKNCFGLSVATAWKRLMSIPAFVKHLNTHISYKCGQPMGLFTSWAVLNMSHHMVLRYLSWRFKTSRRYLVLGDDLVIADKNLAKHYQDYMQKLGVPINYTKSILYEQGKPYSSEFARNIVRDGKSIGCVSPNILIELKSLRNNSLIFEFLRELRLKYGINIYVSQRVALIPRNLYNFLGIKCLKETLPVLTVNQKELDIPVIYLEEGLNPPEGDYIEMPNPWIDVGIGQQLIGPSIKRKWMVQASARTKSLTELVAGLNRLESKSIKGYALELKSHPIRYLLKSINTEITNSVWNVMAGKRVSPTQITTSIDLLVSVLTKGITYRKWRSTQIDRHKNLMKFFVQLHKDMVMAQQKVLESSKKAIVPYSAKKQLDMIEFQIRQRSLKARNDALISTLGTGIKSPHQNLIECIKALNDSDKLK